MQLSPLDQLQHLAVSSGVVGQGKSAGFECGRQGTLHDAVVVGVVVGVLCVHVHSMSALSKWNPFTLSWANGLYFIVGKWFMGVTRLCGTGVGVRVACAAAPTQRLSCRPASGSLHITDCDGMHR